jgi:hypothetical protein
MDYKNSATKGYVGQCKVVVDLLERGYSVYKPLVDDNGIDLLVEMKKRYADKEEAALHPIFASIQVKYSQSFDSYASIRLDVKQSRADYIALVCDDKEDTKCILYMENKSKTHRWTKSIQIKEGNKNNQKKFIHYWTDYITPPF